MIRTTTLRGGAAVALVGATLGFAGTPADAAPVEEIFDVVGEDTWTVPEDVCSVTIEAYGAAGGRGTAELSARNSAGTTEFTIANGDVLSRGGSTTASIAVVPGEELTVRVGGQGGNGTVTAETSPTVVANATDGQGGYNGGADGGDADATVEPAGAAIAVAAAGGGGGGASDVRQGGGDLDDRVVVAGGGGGRGSYGIGADSTLANESNEGGVGGDGAHPDGEDGTDGTATTGSSAGLAGSGGSQTAGGTAPAQVGQADDGVLGDGGEGGGHTTTAADRASAAAGGGAGGGFYGGAGGGTDDATSYRQGGAGGGGGGSGYGPDGAVFESGVRAGDGMVVITYDLDNGDGCESPATTTPTSPAATQATALTPAFTG